MSNQAPLALPGVAGHGDGDDGHCVTATTPLSCAPLFSIAPLNRPISSSLPPLRPSPSQRNARRGESNPQGLSRRLLFPGGAYYVGQLPPSNFRVSWGAFLVLPSPFGSGNSLGTRLGLQIRVLKLRLFRLFVR